MNSILFTEEERNQGIHIGQVHPLQYVHARNHQLKSIQENIQVQRNFEQNKGLESAYLTNLFGEYKRKHEDIQNKRKEQQKYLNPNHFDTILFDTKELKKTKKLQSTQLKEQTFSKKIEHSTQGVDNDYKTSQFYSNQDQSHNDNYEEDYDNDDEISEAQLKEQERLRNELYSTCVEGSELDQNQVIGSVFDCQVKKGEQVIFSIIEKKKEEDEEIKELLTLKKEWLSELKEEIDLINKQNKRLQQKSERSDVCRNTRLVSKLAASLFTQYHVYFDDIFDSLMDDILEEEVEYFNEVENMEINKLNDYEKNKKSFKLKEIVRNQSLSSNLFGLLDQLDQYADEEYQYEDYE